ncbi:MAG: hypothetical protein NZ772_15305 [Cyanobacteria bacterium]|nr:hypothetical protein [Cyanobacteriota bacterium]MDW8202725.1 hypothetical protein [Cyanobacteriota bacterium SKYGB_h_bin112]
MAQHIDIQLWIPVDRTWKARGVPLVIDRRGNAWLEGHVAIQHSRLLLDDYLGQQRLTCCSFQGGFAIDVDGVRWNEGGIDEFWMTMHWFEGLNRVLRGGAIATAVTSVWEESWLVLHRHGDTLTFHDGYAPPFVHPPVSVNLWAFAACLLRAGRVLEQLIARIKYEIEERGFDIAELLAGSQQAPDDTPLALLREKMRIIVKELPGRADFALLDETQRLLEQQGASDSNPTL